MQIKDVEKLTGLTAKSIRYYESMGLLSVKRNEENDYRYYTEDNVYQLKRLSCFGIWVLVSRKSAIYQMLRQRT